MWRKLMLALLCALLVCGCVCAEEAEPAVTPMPDTSDDTRYGGFVGRLEIPSTGLDVAVYRSQTNKQAVVDRKDSACLFAMRGWILADHNTQAFGLLYGVEVGDIAYLHGRDGEVWVLECVEVLEGINTGHGITDKNRASLHGLHDLLMYTCVTNWQDVRVWQWRVVMEDD